MKTRGPRIFSYFTIIALSLSLFPINSAADENDSPLARLSFVQGDVRLSEGVRNQPSLSTGWQQAEANVPIVQGFSIATGEGRAEIEFATGGRVYLAENSLLLFNQLWKDEDSSFADIFLVTGTATFWLQPQSDQSFVIETSTDQIEVHAKDFYFSRMDSYLDGTAITPEGEKGESLDRGGLTKLQMTKGKTLFFRRGELIPDSAISHPVAAATEWDSWVAARVQQAAATTAAALKVSGLSAPVPWLTDLSERGTFSPCEPYGICWEPREQGAAQAPSTPSPAPNAQSAVPTQGFQPQMVTWQQLDWRWGICAAPSSTTVSRMAHTPEELKELQRLQAQANSYALQNQVWSNVACYPGEWIYRHGHYARVLTARTPPRCAGKGCKPVHAPRPVWVRAGGKVGFVPPHPKDVKGKPPVNLKHGIFVPPAAAGHPFQRVDWNSSQKVKVLDKAPKEFHGISAANLRGASAPKIQARLLEEKAGAKSPAAANHESSKITYDYKSRQFLMSGHSASGAKGGVPVGGLRGGGGGSNSGGGHSGGYAGSSNSGGGRSSGSSSSGGSFSGGSSSHAPSGSSGWSGGSSASSVSSGGSASSGGGSRGSGGRP